MGTPEFAVPTLELLIKQGHNIKGVYTQPDRPRNRGQRLCCSPVKEVALKNNIPVFQPLSLRKGDDAKLELDRLKRIEPDVIVVVAYGQILPEGILDIPKYGCINVHASLLPKYRGAAPIQWAIANGEEETGVTTMYMAKGLDTGDMILKESLPITSDMTGCVLHDELSKLGASLLIKTLDLLEKGEAPREVQDDSSSCYAPIILKDMLEIDFTKSAFQVKNFIMAMSDKPGAYSFLCSKRLKIYKAEIVEGEYNYAPGTLVDLSDFIVVCGDKRALKLTDIQLEGCKKMSAQECMRGRKIEVYTVLGKKK